MPIQRSILVVDDEPALVQLLQDMLSSLYTLTTVGTASEARQLLARQPFDLILLDIALPGESGVALCRALKEDAGQAQTPVVFITGDERQMQAAFDAGGVDFLLKPFRQQELLLRIQTHLRLRDMEQALRTQLSLRDLTLLTIAHDLRNSVGASASLIQRAARYREIPADFKDLVQGASYAAKQSYDLLEDMLTWAQALGKRLDFEPTWISGLELCAECLNMLQPKAAQKSLLLTLDVEEDVVFYADKFLMRTILLNLLTNAIKFTAHGSVSVRAGLQEGKGLLEVTDTGTGIAESVVKQLKDHLPVVSQPGTENERGTGLGLKICQEFVQYHGGTLHLLCRPEGGSCMQVSLPLPEKEQPFVTRVLAEHP